MTQKEVFEPEFKPWGETWHPGIMPSRGALNCPCGWSFFTASLEKFNKVVGFSNKAPIETRGLGLKILIGIIIVECPWCFEKFYFHIDANFGRICKDHCDNWPK